MDAKKIGFALALIMPLVLASAVLAYTPATPVTGTSSATVGVNEYLSVTITDLGAAGTGFGNLNPGATDQATTDSPAIGITIAKETNIDVNVSVKGDNFTSGSNTLPVTNVKYDDDATLGEGAETGLPQGSLTTAYVIWWTEPNPTVDKSKNVYYWISVPVEQVAGDYTGTFYIQAAKS